MTTGSDNHLRSWQALSLAGEHGWTVVSVKNDWSKVFADPA